VLALKSGTVEYYVKEAVKKLKYDRVAVKSFVQGVKLNPCTESMNLLRVALLCSNLSINAGHRTDTSCCSDLQ
jgi:hypothetical protein